MSNNDTSKYDEVHDSPEKYPKRNKDGKVLNPSTENWVQPNYAEGRGFIEEAERLTQQTLYERDHPQEDPENVEESENVPETTGSLEDIGENFENAGIESEEEFDMEPEYVDEDDPLNQLLDDADAEREAGAGSFEKEDEGLVSEEEFMSQFQEGGSESQAQGPGQRSSPDDHKGMYTAKGGSSPSRQKTQNSPSSASSSEEDDGPKYRYERTDTGGMRKVRIDKDEQ